MKKKNVTPKQNKKFIPSIADVIWDTQHHGEHQIIAICISPHV